MTRGDLITRALRIVGDTSQTTNAVQWLDDVLLEFEALDLWRFLETSTTYQTEDNVDNVAFSAVKWPGAALTDYSKGLFISSANAPYGLKYIPQVEFKKMHGAETGNPDVFSFWNDTVWLHPTPVSGTLPLLSVHYYRQITLPIDDGDELSDSAKTGMPKKLHPIIMKGVIAHGMADNDDTRWPQWQELYQQFVTSIAIMDNGDYYTDPKDNFGRGTIPARASREYPNFRHEAGK